MKCSTSLYNRLNMRRKPDFFDYARANGTKSTGASVSTGRRLIGTPYKITRSSWLRSALAGGSSSVSSVSNVVAPTYDMTWELHAHLQRADKTPLTITTTKNALITTQLDPCDAYPHSIKISIVGARKVGMACAIAILMRRIASEVCLIDQNSDKASAEAEDIQHASIFLGCPLVVGTSDIYKVKDSAVVVIAVCEKKLEEEINIKHNIEIFKKIIPTIAKLACKAVLLVASQPIDVMSYVTWKLSKFPSSRVLGTGTLLDSCRFQDLLSRKLGLARTSINCMSIGAQGDTSAISFFLQHRFTVSIWSSVHVAGTKIRDINPQMGEADDPEKWRDISEAVNKIDTVLNRKKGERGPNCWALGFCTAEIVDAIVRNTKVVLPVSTYIQWKNIRLASELVLIDMNEDLAKAEAEDISHAAAYLGNPRIVGTKDYACARDAMVCVITVGSQSREDLRSADYLEHNLKIFKDVIPNVSKYAPNSILLILSKPVDILSYVAMKLSGFPPNRVIGLGTFLDSCRFQYFIAQKLGLSANAVQALIIGESGPASVPVWSAVAVMGMPLKDINKEIGTRTDPESWNDLHAKVINTDNELILKKGYHNWAVGICAGEIVDAIVRNTCACFTVSTFMKGCQHGLEKDIFTSLPCMVGRNGVQSFIRLLYTSKEQELMSISFRRIYEAQKLILDKIE
ncbi:L-lactate dehydrogenase A-like 6A [Atta colombica]|uniref:L-lactate dehydrogenase A-like 6A n=1 Tax=Atta colombica TaxID=520822 RepID=A0A195BI43_9HYME|nr:L-lactate dehydrogenase A-like 6A [Atta colombica]